MKRSSDRILTTHVGSLIRPEPLQAFLRAKQARKAFDAKAYETSRTYRSRTSSTSSSR